MNEEAPESPPVPGREPVEEDVGQSTEKKSSEAESSPEAAPVQESPEPPDTVETKEKPSSDPAEEEPSLDPLQEEPNSDVSTDAVLEKPGSDPVQENPSSDAVQENPEEAKDKTEVKEEAKASGGEPPVDWFEPLEEDDDDDRNAEEESLAGESEISEMAGSEKALKKIYQFNVPRRKRSHPDEGWVEWPILGEGWKRKEVVRRSGSSIGQKDVYYLSPRGERVRSRVELLSVLEGCLDLTTFEYKTGKFYDGVAPPTRVRNRVKKKVRERSSSESSWMDRGEGADTPDSHHRLTPSQPKQSNYNQSSVSSLSTPTVPSQAARKEETTEFKIKLPAPSASSRKHPLPSINGDVASEENTLVCAKCGVSFTGTWYDKQRKRPCCPNCWAASKTKEHPMIRFRKWIPCGQCVGCHNTVNCGQCANCKHGLQSPESRKRICRKRKCICPIRKGPGSGGFPLQKTYNEIPETFDDSISSFQLPSLKSSDIENFSVNVDVDDEDEMSTDDDDDWHKKRKRRSCGECKACLCRKDCGTCDFCIDKPKFGGSNKKRQKCRLRQCQRQAMRHLLPFQMGQGEYGTDGTMLPGRPRPHYTYSRKANFKRSKGAQSGFDFTDNEDDDSNLQFNHLDYGQRNGLADRVPHISNHNSELDQFSRWEAEKSYMGRDGQRHIDEDMEEDDDEDFPMITQIFSLADSPAGSGADMENQLMKLLHSLRSSVLPILWYAILVEGPQLQLIQCSKQSNMTDTMVLIDPGFCYQVTVQKQPLLPTHPLYDKYPGRLTSVTEVVNLLLALETYIVCQGLPPREPSSDKDPLILERASTCDFLVKRKRLPWRKAPSNLRSPKTADCCNGRSQ
ncbi:methyl-CpG-binding domain protein 1b [Symphorus nematophorus]